MNAITAISPVRPPADASLNASQDTMRNAQASDLKTDYSSSILKSVVSPFLPENAAELGGSSEAQASMSPGKASNAANDSSNSAASGSNSAGGNWMNNLKGMFDNVMKAVTNVVGLATKLVSSGVGVVTKLLG